MIHGSRHVYTNGGIWAKKVDIIGHFNTFGTAQTDPNNSPVSFSIENGKIVPSQAYSGTVTILGAAVTSDKTYTTPLTTEIVAGTSKIQPWGNINKALGANVNDGNNPRVFALPDLYSSGKTLSVTGRTWQKKKDSYSGDAESHWKKMLEYGAGSASQQLRVLKNGDPVPDIPAFANRDTLRNYLRDFVDGNNKIVLGQSQALFLFELGTTNTNSTAYDLQDLVILVTLTPGE